MSQAYERVAEVPEAVRKEWRDLYRTHNCKEVAERHHPKQSWHVVRAVVAPPTRTHTVTPDEASDWRLRDRNGESLRSIADSTEWSYTTVQRHCRGDMAPDGERNPRDYRRGHVRESLPSRREVLAHPTRQWTEWAQRLGLGDTRFRAAMREAGYRREAISPTGPGMPGESRVSHAPCYGCEESVPVEDLDGDGCAGCAAPAGEEIAEGVTRGDLEREREAYLRRRRAG